jgi:hypothetical protein
MFHHSWILVCVKSHKLSIFFSIFQVFKLPYLHTINWLNIMVSCFLSSKSTNFQVWIVSIDSISKWITSLQPIFLHLSFLVVVNFPSWWWNHHISMEVSWVDLIYSNWVMEVIRNITSQTIGTFLELSFAYLYY